MILVPSLRVWIGGEAISFRMIATNASLSTMTFFNVPVLRLGIWIQSSAPR
jgi:hypothetical protein